MTNSPKNGGNFLVNLVRGSMILNALDRFTAYIYSLIKRGFLGWLFTGYDGSGRSVILSWLAGCGFVRWLDRRRKSLCRRLDSSVILNFVPYMMRFFLGCRLRVYGAFLASFGLYTAVVTAVSSIIAGQLSELLDHSYVLISVVMIFASLPLILSGKTLAEGILSSAFGRLILNLTGYEEHDLKNTVGSGGHMNTAFLVGIICGALTYRFSPLVILIGLAGMVWAYLVLIRPEIGVLTLFAGIPWVPTMVLAAVVIYTALCWFIKLFRGKRIYRPEPVDIMAAAFAVMLAFGGFISLSGESLKPALLMVCLLCGYFLAVGLLTSREWLIRCSVTAVVSGVLQSICAVVMLYTGIGYSSDAWLDEEMFEDIAGRAVGTLENPNMFGEYLILLLPLAFAMLIGRGEGMRKISALFCIGVLGTGLILSMSRGAWLGLIFGMLLFLFMWHRRSMWLILAGAAAVPFLPLIVPERIWNRLASIGNLADSSTAYRVHIWHSSSAMIRDNYMAGIGVGEGAWFKLYPLYAYMGVGAAPHSHNLFMQIWLDLGLIGFVLFLWFLFLLLQSGFTMFYNIGAVNGLRTPDISRS
ncbi:MAG: O-antigen ligase family protein, partial [Clostridia bacterium]|nr:O-antigen ligase family protein [Clostridia bacterium]